jgi:glycosyltransferase involved in cell wall biosynthesis
MAQRRGARLSGLGYSAKKHGTLADPKSRAELVVATAAPIVPPAPQGLASQDHSGGGLDQEMREDAVTLTPLFSVVVVSRNRAKTLQGAIRCLAKQRLPRHRYEIVVVDNGSTDHTCAIVGALKKTTPNLRYFFLPEPNVSSARNFGAEQARGRWLAFTDDDCLPPEDWLSQGEIILQRMRGVKVFGGPIFDVMPGGVSSSAGYKLAGWQESYGKEARFLFPNEFFIECNLFFEKREFIACGGFNVLLGPGNRRFGFHEGTELQARMNDRFAPKPIRYYDPAVQMRHLARPTRSSPLARLKRALVAGFDYSRAFPKRNRHQEGAMLVRAMALSSVLPWAAIVHQFSYKNLSHVFERLYFRTGETWGEILGMYQLFQTHLPGPSARRTPWQRLCDQILPLAKSLANRFGKNTVSEKVALFQSKRGSIGKGILGLERKKPSFSQYHVRCREVGPPHPLLAFVGGHRSPPWMRGRIRSAQVYGPTPAVLDAGGRLVEELSRDWGKTDIHLGIMRSLSLPPVQELSGRTFLAAQLGGETYFHWMIDVVPLLLEEQGRMGGLKGFSHILTHHPLKPFQRQSFERLEVEPKKILGLTKRKGFRCQELVFHTAHHLTGRASASSLRSVARLFLGKTKTSARTPRRLALLRGPESHRSLLRRQEIADLLAYRGFVEYEPSRDTVEEQARIFAGAEVIVAVHGAALTNLIFCRAGTRVLELFSARYVNPCYVHISQQLGLRHHACLDFSIPQGVSHDLTQGRHPILTTAQDLHPALELLGV